MKTYLDAALEGKNNWWRFLIAYPVIIITWFIVGAIPIFAVTAIVMLDDNPLTNIIASGFVGIDPLLNYAVTMISFIPLLLATLLVVRFLHQRPARTLVTPNGNVDWQRLFVGFGIWFVLAAVMAVIESLLYPGRYTLTLDAAQLIPFAIFSILIVPVQTSSEEIFFRGYLVQNLGLKIRNPLALSLLSGILFTLPHLANPEIAENVWLVPLFYFSFGAFAAFITLRDNGLELALGMHAGNNLFASLFANYTNSALQTPALYTINEFDVAYNLISPLVGMAIFYVLVFRVWPKKAGLPAQAALMAES